MPKPVQQTEENSASQANAPLSMASGETVVRIKSQDLFRHMREVEIDHDGRIYRLRVTQFNKLILTA